MSGRRHLTVTILLVIGVSLCSTMLAAIFLSRHYSRMQFERLSRFCQMFAEAEGTDAEGTDADRVLAIIKERKALEAPVSGEGFLADFGYKPSDFTDSRWRLGHLIAAICFGLGVVLVLLAFLYRHRKESARIQELTEYLEKVNTGGQEILLAPEEDDYARLQDEIYKTVTTLYQTRDAALTAQSNFADNLYNIAHQLKTPITAISLSAQMMEGKGGKEGKEASEYSQQIRRQVTRLSYLEEALLLLSRIDAGTLTLEHTNVDVFTLLNLSADHLQELLARAEVTIDIPEKAGSGDAAVEITADMEWTMEAVMNLMKNCMEHSPAGKAVHCSYEQNPLYTQIRIWDEGPGFKKEDIPHLFERFYRGEHASKGGIGIGLALSKAIIEMQSGMISAGNVPEGGAYFEIRMYSH